MIQHERKTKTNRNVSKKQIKQQNFIILRKKKDFFLLFIC